MKYTVSICRDSAPYHNLCWMPDNVLEAIGLELFSGFSPKEEEPELIISIVDSSKKTHLTSKATSSATDFDLPNRKCIINLKHKKFISNVSK